MISVTDPGLEVGLSWSPDFLCSFHAVGRCIHCHMYLTYLVQGMRNSKLRFFKSKFKQKHVVNMRVAGLHVPLIGVESEGGRVPGREPSPAQHELGW